MLEDDPGAEAVIEPARVVPRVAVPERAVLCFFGDVVTAGVAGRKGGTPGHGADQ